MPSIANFVRNLQKPILKAFLLRYGLELSQDELAAEPKQMAEAIVARYAEHPPGFRSRFEYELDKICALAKGAGQVAVEQVFPHSETLDLPIGLNRAVWLYLHDPEGFRHAEEVLYNDERRGTKKWTPYKIEPSLVVRQDEDALERFRQRLMKECDTSNVHLDIFERGLGSDDGSETDEVEDQHAGSRVLQVTIYREGKPTDDLTFEDSKLKASVRRQVIEASVTYEPATGTIECVAGNRDVREQIVANVAVELLGCASDLQPVEQRAYDLTVLRQPIEFESEPLDGIDSVRVTKMVLSPIETRAERITLESRRKGPDMWAMATQRLGDDALTSNYTIDQAELSIRYRPRNSNKPRILRVSITHPSSSNVKEHTDFDYMISRKYLPRWGLASP
ncbi:hypothetical protein ABGN05_13910 [Aquibium sp. LZ166]|uniref:WYL domain-containing protein n=1 Tax=Aquibium pacificus TaxID=3153579 RepID=A0ABV3SKI1_9HYPH